MFNTLEISIPKIRDLFYCSSKEHFKCFPFPITIFPKCILIVKRIIDFLTHESI